MMIYTMGLMADLDHHALRLPAAPWARFGEIVGNRTADLKAYMDWCVANPDLWLAEDLSGPHRFIATFRIEPARWELFNASLGDCDYSSRLRSYIGWRIEHPNEPLPGRRITPVQGRRLLACVS